MALSDFRVEGEPGSPWVDIKPLQTNFRGSVLAFDQSLGSTGWVALQFEQGGLAFLGAGMIATQADGRIAIAEDTYRRGVKVEAFVAEVFECHHADLVVLELPPTGARQLKQVTSPLLAGYPIYREAARRNCEVVIVQGQKAKKRWTGNASAKKSMVREALVAQFPWVADIRPLNEHTTDAVLLALTAIDGREA